MLQMDKLVQLELALDVFNLLGVRLENVVHIMPSLQVTSIIGKLAAAHLLDLIELGPFRFHFLRDGSDEFVDTIFLSRRVQNNQAFVFPVHPLVLSVAILDRFQVLVWGLVSLAWAGY